MNSAALPTPDTPAESPNVAALLATARRDTTAFDPADGPGALIWHGWGAGPPHCAPPRRRRLLATLGPATSPPSPPPAASSRPTCPASASPTRCPRPTTPPAPPASSPGASTPCSPATACDLVGFSFGATVAGHIAAAHPGLVRSLVLVGAGGLGLPRAPITLVPVRSLSGPARTAANRTNLERLMIADPARIDAEALAIQDWNGTRARVKSVGFAGSAMLLDALRRIQCPLGAIWGERDHVALPDLPARVAALRAVRPEAPIAIIPGAGHWVQFEAPAAFDAALARTLAALR